MVQSYSSGGATVTPSNACFLRLTLIDGSLSQPEPTTQTTSRSVQLFLQSSRLWQTDRQTDHATRSVRILCIYVHGTVMRPNNDTVVIIIRSTPPSWPNNIRGGNVCPSIGMSVRRKPNEIPPLGIHVQPDLRAVRFIKRNALIYSTPVTPPGYWSDTMSIIVFTIPSNITPHRKSTEISSLRFVTITKIPLDCTLTALGWWIE